MIMSLEKSRKIIEEYINDADFCGSIEPMKIERAEEILGTKFPSSYKEFLTLYGCGDLFGVEIFGIIKDPDIDGKSVPNGIWLTLDERSNGMNKHLIVISETGDGAYYVLNTEQRNELNECPVCIWYRDGELEFFAPTFDDFLSETLQDMID